jgi:hypothetical protein
MEAAISPEDQQLLTDLQAYLIQHGILGSRMLYEKKQQVIFVQIENWQVNKFITALGLQYQKGQDASSKEFRYGYLLATDGLGLIEVRPQSSSHQAMICFAPYGISIPVEWPAYAMAEPEQEVVTEVTRIPKYDKEIQREITWIQNAFKHCANRKELVHHLFMKGYVDQIAKSLLNYDQEVWRDAELNVDGFGVFLFVEKQIGEEIITAQFDTLNKEVDIGLRAVKKGKVK